MLKKTKVSAAAAAFIAGLAVVATSAYAQTVERIEITGSAIRRIDAESVVPVTVLKVDDLKSQGITTIEQALNSLAANQSLQGTSQSVGLGTGGASFANLRALGANKTLVLLNGRRVANNAIDGSSPDLNMIPFAALDRVEVLRDGASALYGTDAIGGVINFITRKDYSGGSLTLGADSPQHAGGKSTSANISFGYGDLGKQGFNVFGVIDMERQDPLRGSQRNYNDRSVKTSPTTAIGQYNQGGAVQNPSFPTCGSPDGIPLGDGVTDATCGYLYPRKVDLIPKTERQSALLRGTLQLGTDHALSLEYLHSTSDNATKIAGVPYGALWMNPGTTYYPGNGITPLPTVFTLNPAYKPSTAPAGALPGVIKLRWRDADSGGRQEGTNNTQDRLVLSIEGVLAGWDYKAGVAYNENKLTDMLTGGYTDGGLISAAILNGTLNPFGPQSAAGATYLSNAATKGTLFTAYGKVTSVDAQASHELGDWFGAGRQAAIAVGTEFRTEKFNEKANVDFATKVISSTGFDPATDNGGKRNVSALYTELNFSVIKEIEVTAALRYDRYSDVGNTNNPKVGVKYQPSKGLLLRSSYSTGFRAPSLYELNNPQTFTNTSNNWDDPVRCPGGVPIAGVAKSDNCKVQFMELNGGNPKLHPEKAKNLTFGIVFEPTANLSASIDFWWIRLKDQIGTLPDETIFGNAVKYASLFKRAPDGSLATDGSLCPGVNCGYVLATNLNLGGANATGLDLGLNYKLRSASLGELSLGLNGTLTNKYEYQNEPGGEWFQNVGIYSGSGPIFRWQHTATANWSMGMFSVGLANHFKSGYQDQDPSIRVPVYSTWDAFFGVRPIKGLSLTLGVHNLLDTDAPKSLQARTFQVGYDPRYADPLGRTYYVRGTYSF